MSENQILIIYDFVESRSGFVMYSCIDLDVYYTCISSDLLSYPVVLH